MSISLTQLRRVAAAAALLLGTLAAAAPGSKVLFVSNRDGNAQIHVMNADGSDDHALTRGAQENTEPNWSPDGRRIAFTSYRDGNAEIYVMDADGGRPTRLTQHARADNAPVWTPDGRIVFRSMRERWANFYVMDADGSRLQALTASAVDKGSPVLSPDGRWIAYITHGEQGRSELHLLPATGGTPKNLTGALSKNQKSFPSWSPDSRRLAYVEVNNTALNIKVIDVDGGNPGKLTDNGYTNAFPVWSPDGQRIAFVSSREGSRSERARGDIYVMNADGSGADNLTRHPDEDNYPAWSADGLSVYFVSLRDGTAQLYAVPAAGGESLRLTRHQGHDVMIRPAAPLPSPAAVARAEPAATPPQNTP